MQEFVASQAKLKSQRASGLTTTPVEAKPSDLSARETEILRLLAKSMNTVQISNDLGISQSTVRNHIKHIMTKLGAHTRLKAVRRAQQGGVI